MSDRDLLELAAKAAGYTITDWCAGRRGADWAELSDTSKWNPIEDDGDALRLAVKLSIDMSFNFENAVFVYADEVMETLDRNGNDLCAATRRAIVRAAAEIGKGIQLQTAEGVLEDNYYKSQAEAEELGRQMQEGGAA